MGHYDNLREEKRLQELADLGKRLQSEGPCEAAERINRALGEETEKFLQELTDLGQTIGVGYDSVNHPKHYTQYPGIEVIQLTEHLNFCRGNAVKYIARAGLKGDELEDLKKAAWYVNREIERLSK